MANVASRARAYQVQDGHVTVSVVIANLADPDPKGDVGKLIQIILGLRPMVELKSRGIIVEVEDGAVLARSN